MPLPCPCPIGECPDLIRAESVPAAPRNEQLPPDSQPQPYKVQHPWSRSRRKERAQARSN